MGTKALQEIIETRNNSGKFETLFDFTSKVSLKAVNRKVLESLNMAGALDSLEGNRAQKHNSIDTVLKYGQTVQENNARNQVDLFGVKSSNGQDMTLVPQLVSNDEWEESQLLENYF